jgi:hypothetical protein
MSLAALLANPSAVFALHQIGAESSAKLAKSMLKDPDYQKVWHLLPAVVKAEQAIVKACKAKDAALLASTKAESKRLSAEMLAVFKA